MEGDPELIFPSTTKLNDGMPSHLGGFTSLVTDPFAVLFLLLLTHHHHLMALVVYVKKNHPFT